MGVLVAVIGAGTAGLCAAKHVLQNGMEPIVFEQSKEIGGTWVYTDQIGKDEYGIDVHTSMYKGLQFGGSLSSEALSHALCKFIYFSTNLPKEIMGYPDFPIPDQDKSYIPSEDMLRFLNLYADEFKVKERILFQHYVIRIRPRGMQWEIIVKDLPNDKIKTYMFDYVMVCNGHYHTPHIPTYPGQDIFKGRIIHSHDYRCPQAFKDETVLVVGAGPSGMDLALEISKHAKRVTLSHHMTEKPRTSFPPNVNQKPDILKITENGVVFTDDTQQDYSLIFYCTGYKYSFPFLSVDCGLHVEDNFVRPLYKHCININNHTMALIGLPFYVCASQMMDLQVRFVMRYFSGQKKLPSAEEMLKDTENEMEERWKKGYKRRQAHMMGPDQEKYYRDLSETAEIENLKPVMTKLHNESSKRFLDDLVNFRKDVFRIVDDETYIKIN